MTFLKSFFQTFSRRFAGFNDACVFFVVQLSKTLQVSLYSSRLVLQRIAAGIGTSHFLRAFFIISLNSSSAGSRKQIPRFFSSIVKLRTSIAHFFFSLRFDASDISFQTSGHRESSLDVVCFLVSPLPDHVYPSGVFSSIIVNLVTPVHVSDNSRSPSTFQ